LRDVLSYAIGYAAAGFPLVPAISWAIASVADIFTRHWHSSAEVYLAGGDLPADPGRGGGGLRRPRGADRGGAAGLVRRVRRRGDRPVRADRGHGRDLATAPRPAVV